MTESEVERVSCQTHGEAYATFVCGHLAEGAATEWYSAEPIDADPWPSAWCDACHRAFLAEGEWNERSEAAADLRVTLICHRCYEALRARCMRHVV